nr:S-layer protein [uncultured Methanoregula sp.]
MQGHETRWIKEIEEEMAIRMEEAQDNGDRKCEWNAGKTGEPMKFFSRVFIILSVIVFLAVPVAAIDTGASTTNPTVIITDYRVTPAVLLPGDRGTVTLTIKNTAESASVKENSGITTGGIFANTKSTDINVFIENVHLEGNGVAILTGDFNRLGELGPGQAVPVTFVIRAPEKDGIYFPEVWIDVKDARSTRYPVMVNVNTDISTQKKPALSVTQQLPEMVAPGEKCTIGIGITNTGLTRASDIAMIINSTTKSLILTTSGRYYREHLDPGEGTNLTLGLATDKNTPLGIDPVTLIITYHDPDGTPERQVETIGIPVKGKAEVAVKSLTTDPVRPVPGSTFTLILRAENTGTDQATSVRATLDSPFTGTKTAFIGSIDKNSDAPAIFYLQATKDGTLPANVTISYHDDFGFHTIDEPATVTTSPSAGLLPVVVVVMAICLIAGAAYWYFRLGPGKRNGE